ncbi:hypothetical protein CIHG_08228 [Coccidioides immitis H538.4]|uniref:Uncharacterized protein n=3 Tax=Coccidioides immitis TaxID=5501 RepID=A0A0J8TZN1_COCIT|nr:hypothetical protein CIRG_04293 [Coccidioides immitis RMSCC 2394]KMU79457.1 hypothetical protein CISG_07888 [Coccidioides immitis RMSCC 3703]KMU90418.1 hypothetical protein CIHG_08228 [Coccidioides immitis H538.4]
MRNLHGSIRSFSQEELVNHREASVAASMGSGIVRLNSRHIACSPQRELVPWKTGNKGVTAQPDRPWQKAEWTTSGLRRVGFRWFRHPHAVNAFLFSQANIAIFFCLLFRLHTTPAAVSFAYRVDAVQGGADLGDY